jgi:putative CocE/NonD family hydrolase
MQRRRSHPLVRLGRRAAEAVAGLPGGSTDYVVTPDVRTPMRDGVELLGDLYRPRDPDPAPVVLIRTPYGRAGLGSRLFAIVLARRGFQVLVQSVRGTFGSGGAFRPYTDEHEDGLDTLAWVRAQEWCDGRVATTGASYFGHTQWAVAPYADPPLVASSLHVTGARISDLLYEHGAPGILNGLSWSDLLARQERPFPNAALGGVGRRLRVLRAARSRPLREADLAVAGERVQFWRDLADHAEPDDPFWSVADHDGADLGRMPPVTMVTGWWDLFLELQLHDYTRLRAAGVPARLTVGPWLHGVMPEVREMLRTDAEWLEHHLHGGPAPAGPPVRVWLQQADEWLALETWPPPDAVVQRRHLTPDAALAAEPVAGAAAPSTFVFDPDDPTPVEGGPLLAPPGKQVDNGVMESSLDVLVFTGAPEPGDLDLLGGVAATVFVRPELDHADVFVRLCDVDEQGVSRNVVDGVRRLDPRTVPAPDVRVGADGVLAVEVELFPTAYRVLAGHRLRLVISGGAFPRFAPNTGEPGSQADALTGRVCRFAVFHDAEHPSHLTLSVRKDT